jgi:hypothetical protein
MRVVGLNKVKVSGCSSLLCEFRFFLIKTTCPAHHNRLDFVALIIDELYISLAPYVIASNAHFLYPSRSKHIF